MNWFNSTNAKEIGTLYLVFAVFSGMIGTAFSVMIRLELSSPGVQFLSGDHQLFNVIISAHAFIMIFFMVNLFLSQKTSLIHLRGKFNNVKFQKVSTNFSQSLFKSKSTKVRCYSTLSTADRPENLNTNSYFFNNPFENRKSIAEFAKNKKGVYVFSIAPTRTRTPINGALP